ncbi:hypothetical protein [Paenibacillus puerhi]|uniref:hypothetical protein n=1 Tax=Paenibacillus puerhi TaxID=2692622 RepID=UPI001F2653B9|nr:hypothetical protein [Paenibacillus puerhi]
MRIKTILALALAASLFAAAGCQSRQSDDAADRVKMQRTVGRERLLQTMDQISAPSMAPSIMEQSDEQIVTWVKQIDDWTHQVLSSPVTGEIDRYAMEEMRKRLSQLYTRDMADRQIAYFYRHNGQLGTYQAYSTKAMLGLRSEWGQYELKKSRGENGTYHLNLKGTNVQQGTARSAMQHESAYRLERDRLIITEFKTSS